MIVNNENPKASFAGRLPRLAPERYEGRTFVHWVMTIDQRRRGWLDDLLHARVREALLHACVRHRLACAFYTLMPDHGHFLLLGTGDFSSQKGGVRLFRRGWNAVLPAGYALQRQAYDHVLCEEEREREVFARIAWYIRENPVRAGIVPGVEDWPYSGSLVPGYPSLDSGAAGFWNSFWLAFETVSNAAP